MGAGTDGIAQKSEASTARESFRGQLKPWREGLSGKRWCHSKTQDLEARGPEILGISIALCDTELGGRDRRSRT